MFQMNMYNQVKIHQTLGTFHSGSRVTEESKGIRYIKRQALQNWVKSKYHVSRKIGGKQIRGAKIMKQMKINKMCSF